MPRRQLKLRKKPRRTLNRCKKLRNRNKKSLRKSHRSQIHIFLRNHWNIWRLHHFFHHQSKHRRKILMKLTCTRTLSHLHQPLTPNLYPRSRSNPLKSSQKSQLTRQLTLPSQRPGSKSSLPENSWRKKLNRRKFKKLRPKQKKPEARSKRNSLRKNSSARKLKRRRLNLRPKRRRTHSSRQLKTILLPR